MQIFGRDAERYGCSGNIRWPQICRLVGKNIRLVTAGRLQWWNVDQSHRRYVRYRLHRINHALLHCRHSVAAVAGHTQICVCQHRVARFKTEIAVHRACQPTYGHHRRSNQHRTDRDLRAKQQVPGGKPSPHRAAGSRLDDLIGIRAKDLLHWDHAEQEPAGYTQQQGHSINICVRADRHIYWVLGKWPPHAQPTQQRYAAPKSGSASHQ